MLKLFSPAKINLFLNVFQKRSDGYHSIETVFERVSLGDTIHLGSMPEGIELRCSGPEKVPAGSENLAWRAAKLIRESCRVQQGVRIQIHKNIPVSAGLGGGSSNAAAVLLGLNRLWKLGLPKSRLLSLGAKLGSDVPFFILEASMAYGKGRGEVLKSLPAPRKRFWHVLVKPPFGISTREAYRGFSKAKPGPGLTLQKADVRMLLHSIHRGDLVTLSRLLTNSLEVTLNKRVTSILKIKKELLKEGASGALLSGSGSCVFGLFSSRQNAMKTARRLRRAHKTWKVFAVSTY